MLFPGLKQLLCQISALNMSNQYLQQYVQIQAVALIQEQLLSKSSFYPRAALIQEQLLLQ